jgi:4'-phosphopantetheinyl transferase
VVCRAALRSILGARLGVSPADVRFDYGEYGRPSLRGMERSGPYFNVSHSRDVGCIAVASGYDVGIDVEAVRQLNALDQMIHRTLAPTEQRQIAALPASDRMRTFFRYWTLKEALLKVVGVGLQRPLREIEIDLGIKGRIVSTPADIPVRGRYLLQELDLGNDYCGALAVESVELPQIEYRDWPSWENETGTERPPGR